MGEGEEKQMDNTIEPSRVADRRFAQRDRQIQLGVYPPGGDEIEISGDKWEWMLGLGGWGRAVWINKRGVLYTRSKE
jgi:hypothetical protein